MNMINPESLIHRNDTQFLASDLGNELVMMNLETGDYISLNEVSASIWKLLEQPSKPAEVISRLLERYEIDEENCSRQTFLFLNKMYEQQMITVK